MSELYLEWNEFVKYHKTQEIKTWVDLNKGHALLKSSIGPKNWRVTINFFSWMILISYPIAIILFFFVKWWIPILIIVIALFISNSIRQEAAKAIVETSLNDPNFYVHSIKSGTLKVFVNKT